VLADPLRIDRLVGQVARAQQSFLAALHAGRGEDHAFELSGRELSLELLRELADATHDPLAPRLLRFAHRLREAYSLLDLDRDHARALRSEHHPIDAPERGRFTPSMLRVRALADKPRRAAYLAVLAERATRATDFALRRAERRTEHRAGCARLVPPDIDLPGPAVIEVAATALARTSDAYRALAPRTFADVIELGLGCDSRAAWPARITTQNLAALFAEAPWLAHVSPDPFPLPAALGAASHLRALFGFGAALRVAFSAEAQPFVLARDPYGLERMTFGSLFALLPSNEPFARRRLGVGASAFADHRRSLARVLLVALRSAALRVSLRAPAFSGTQALSRAYTELAHEALGVELAPNLLGVLFTPRPADAQRFAAFLLATSLADRLTQTHDEDWFRNPRAVDEMRELSRAPVETVAEKAELERGLDLLVGWLAEGM
jgi:hypothetical protein